MSLFEEFVRDVERVTGRHGRRRGVYTRLLCPAHEDHDPSLDASEAADGRPLAICRSQGCTFEAICRAIGREPNEFTLRNDDAEWTPRGSAVAIYEYTDEDGRLLFQVLRTADKQFPQRTPTPRTKSGWRWKVEGVRRVLYRLPEVLAAVVAGEVVYVCEGEKDVESLRRLGVAATCNPGGAGKWREEYSHSLGGADVVVIADRDDAGRKHALAVAAALAGIASSVKVVEPAKGKDATDHVDAGLTLKQLVPVDADPHHGRAAARSQAAHLLDLAMGAELFHTPSDEAFASFPVGTHRETWQLRSGRFKSWLSKQLWDRDGTIPTSSARNDALTVLEGIAAHDSPTLDVHVRLAADGEAIYLDLGNTDWEVIKIDANGWGVDAHAPVRFRRSRGTLALPSPAAGGSIDDLKSFVNVDGDGWILFASWLVCCLRPRGPYPVLNLLGEQGAAKSTAARVARALVDPNRAALRTSPREPRDFIVTTTNSWVTALDNLSNLPEWLSDALCRLSTGGGFVTRELYTDSDEVIFDAQRPVVLTGITEVATRSDLLDRSLLITLPNIAEDARLPEEVFWQKFDDARPSILGALLDAVSTALDRQASLKLPYLPRMADFAVWSAAAAPALGWTEEAFLGAYERNRSAVHEIALEGSPAGHLILEIGRQGFEGTATDLLKRLSVAVDEKTAKERGWPKTPRSLSGTLRRLAPNLRALGVDVTFGRETVGEKRRLVSLKPLRRLGTRVTPATGPVPPPPDGGADDPAGDATSAAEDAVRHSLEPAVTEPGSPGDAGDASDAHAAQETVDPDQALADRLRERHRDIAESETT